VEGICYIIAAGPVEPLTLNASDGDFVIAADAGYLHLSALSAAADLVVGDFDSMAQKPDHPNVVTHPAAKDKTDTLLAIDEGLRRGYRRFIILGGLGGRLDHTLANIQALSYIAASGGRGFLVGNGTAITVIRNGRLRLEGGKTGVISVFCCGDAARGVYLRGLKYELRNAVLTGEMPLGVSNEFTGAPSEISVRSGSLAVLWEDKTADVIDSLREPCYFH